MNPWNYKFIMPFLAATLGVPRSGNAIWDCQLVVAKAQSIKNAITSL